MKRPPAYSPHPLPTLNNFYGVDCSSASKMVIDDVNMTLLSPLNIKNISDYENNIANNLEVFMSYIKVYPYYGHVDIDNPTIPTAIWKKWKMYGFTNNIPHYCKSLHDYSWNGYMMDWQEERNVYKMLYRRNVNKAAIAAVKNVYNYNNIILYDMNVTSEIYDPTIISNRGKKYSHVHIIAELLSE